MRFGWAPAAAESLYAGALDHAGLHAVQEMSSPGYLSRIRSKQKKDWGGGYWWRLENFKPGAELEQLSGATDDQTRLNGAEADRRQPMSS